MHLSDELLKHAAAAHETIIIANERGEPSCAVIPYKKYLRLLHGSDSINSARKEGGLTGNQLLDTINREIAQRKDEQQLPLTSGSDSDFVNTPYNHDSSRWVGFTDRDDEDLNDNSNDEEDQLYLEDITS